VWSFWGKPGEHRDEIAENKGELVAPGEKWSYFGLIFKLEVGGMQSLSISGDPFLNGEK
jgi:hypothetical protein